MTATRELSEQDYAEIGRALVDRATEEAIKKVRNGVHVDKGKAVQLNGFTVYVRFEEMEDASMSTLSPDIRPVRCCTCFFYGDSGQVICKGWCCPT